MAKPIADSPAATAKIKRVKTKPKAESKTKANQMKPQEAPKSMSSRHIKRIMKLRRLRRRPNRPKTKSKSRASIVHIAGVEPAYWSWKLPIWPLNYMWMSPRAPSDTLTVLRLFLPSKPKQANSEEATGDLYEHQCRIHRSALLSDYYQIRLHSPISKTNSENLMLKMARLSV